VPGRLDGAHLARFPAKVRKLVLAGAPIDIAAAPSVLSTLADVSPLPVFHELVGLGDGIVPGRKVMKFWGTEAVAAEDMWQVLQTEESIGSDAFAYSLASSRHWTLLAGDGERQAARASAASAVFRSLVGA
jgi:hypothetical protein